MGVEVATYINDLDSAAPGATDLRSQGDDHLRLLKTVLKTQFTGATRAFQIPGASSKVASYTVLKTDGESTIYVNTGAGTVILTLPALVAADAGWKFHFIKTNSGLSPIFVVPAAGTLNSGGLAGLARARRCVPGARITVIWDGTGWFVTRAVNVPIGTMLDFHAATLPAGFEWPNGQVLAAVATDYPEYSSINGGSGNTYDLRGRVSIPLDNLGGATAGRLAGGIITGTSVGQVGGTDTVTLGLTQLPGGITSANAAQAINVSHTVTGNMVKTTGVFAPSLAGTGGDAVPYTAGTLSNVNSIASSGNNAISVTSNNTGGLAHSNLQPSIMLAKILVVE